MGKINLFIIFAIISTGIQAQEGSFDPEQFRDREIHAVRLNTPLVIDGHLHEDLYNTVSNSTFIQYVPDNGERSSQKTEVWVGYDDHGFFIGARLWDTHPDSIVARLGRRDSGEDSDLFQVAIDSYYDRRSGFFFNINPVGTITDGTVANDSDWHDSWDGIWEGKAQIDSQGWTAEMRIPFTQLRFNIQDEILMGFGLGRRIHRREEQDLYTYVPRDVSGFLSHFPTLRGLKNINPPKRMEITPYITSSYSSLPSENENPFFNGRDAQLTLGTDLKLGIGNNLTLDAAINPDFGQVEVDPSELNLTDFETFYREKRPFFIEGANIFRFGMGGPTNRFGFGFYEPRFFYSRRIGRPPQNEIDTEGWLDSPSNTSILGAAKLSGKLPGGWSVGGLSAVTRKEHARVEEDGDAFREEVEPLTIYNIFRTQKEIKGGIHGLGLIGSYVHRVFDDKALRDILLDNSTVVGIDGWTFFDDRKTWALSGFFGYSKINGSRAMLIDVQESSNHYFQKPNVDHVKIDSSRTTLDGWSSRFLLNKEAGNWVINASLGAISPGFENNDIGLNFKTDQINKHIVLGYKWLESGRFHQEAALHIATFSNHNFDWEKINQAVFMFGFMQLKNYWTVGFFSGWGPRTISDDKLRGGPLVASPAGVGGEFFIESDSRRSIGYGLGLSGRKIDGGSYGFNIHPGIEINFGTQLQLDIEGGYDIERSIDQYVDVFDDPNAVAMSGKRYILAQLDRKTFSTDIRIDYTFTPTLSFQAYFQPYITVGSYSHFKEFERPRSYDFVEYGEGGSTIEFGEEEHILDPTGGSDEDAITLENPDFNFKALVGTAVLRWEFNPGSTFYLVWTRNGSDEQHPGEFNFGRDLGEMFSARSDNILALKVSYWFGR